MSNSITPAGVTFSAGKPEECLVIYFEIQDNNRYKLALKDGSDEKITSHDLLHIKFLKDCKITQSIVDFPLSTFACHSCELKCPGSDLCPVSNIKYVRQEMNRLLEEDNIRYKENPKKYEEERKSDDLFEWETDLLAKRTDEHLLSKAFKRRLKKGISPFSNRPLDFWVWQHYYDAHLSVFQSSFDSFGDYSFSQYSFFKYWKRHLPQNFELFETSPQLVLLELHRAEILEKKQLFALMDINQAPLARLEIVRTITHQFQLIITESQYDKLVRHPRAFMTFLLAIAGIKKMQNCTYNLPHFAEFEHTHFFVPYFLSKS